MAVIASDLQRALNRMVGIPNTWTSSALMGRDVQGLMRSAIGISVSDAMRNVDQMAGFRDAVMASHRALLPRQWDVLRNSISAGDLLATVPKFDIRQLMLPVDFGDVIDQFQERLERGEDGRTVLQEMQEPWLTALFDATEFADWLVSSSEQRRQALDDTAEGLLSDPEYVEEIRGYIESLDLTRPRWRLIGRALRAHSEEDYLASVPLFLSQFEGLYADLLIVGNLVKRDGGRLWELDPATGEIKQDTKGRGRVRVNGLDRIVQLSGFRNHEGLRDFASFVATYTCPFRNAALHGSSLDFDTKQNSYRTALMVTILAREFNGITSAEE